LEYISKYYFYWLALQKALAAIEKSIGCNRKKNGSLYNFVLIKPKSIGLGIYFQILFLLAGITKRMAAIEKRMAAYIILY
jgi:hypothetical protein